MNQYLKEIEEFYLKLKKNSLFLTPKERELILKWYRQKIPLNLVKQTIKQEYLSFPVKKSKNFNLIIVDKKLSQLTKNKKIENPVKKNPKNKRPDLSDIDQKISLIWKNLPQKEKEKIKEEAKNQIKHIRISKDEYMEAVKLVIKKIIEERYISK